MIMDCEKYVGKCVCGRDHELETKKVVVEYGAINNFEQYMADVGLAGKKRAVIYDTVIYKLTEGKHVAADQEIVLEANGLRAEDTVIEEMMKKLDNPEVIVAYGAGTIMDFGRYPAYKLGIPFVAIPTLASSDYKGRSGTPCCKRHKRYPFEIHFSVRLEGIAPRCRRILLPDGSRPCPGSAGYYARSCR